MKPFISEDEAKRQVNEILGLPNMIGKPRPWPAPTPKKKTIRYKERVSARLGKGGKPRDAIVTIDKHQVIRIRPFRGRRIYVECSMEQAVAWLVQKMMVPEGLGKRRR